MNTYVITGKSTEILTEAEVTRHAGRGTHAIVQSMCRLTIPAIEVILAAGGKIGPAYNGCWQTPRDLHSVLLQSAASLGLVYCQTPDWDSPGHLTSAIRMSSEPAYPFESHTTPIRSL